MAKTKKTSASDRIPLMPIATAVWLVDNTGLTFEQIAKFCSLHILEVKGIADGEVATSIAPSDPIINKQLTEENIKYCEANPDADLILGDEIIKLNQTRLSGVKFTPRALRNAKVSAILWVVKNYPDIPDSKIIKLLRSTKATINSIRNKTHRSYTNLSPQDPVLLGLCSQQDWTDLLNEMQSNSQNTQDKN